MPAPLRRRTLLQLLLASGAASRVAAETSPDAIKLTDTNVSLFHWPCRRLPLDEPEQLVEKLRALGITQAWAGSFEGLLHRDLDSVNDRLAGACARHGPGLLLASGSVNPALPGWRETLRRCARSHAMRMIRLHPNHHGYKLEHPAFAELLDLAAEHGLLVQLAASTEDTRTQHPQTQVPDVDLRPLLSLLPKLPNVKLQVLNHRPSAALTPALAALPKVWFDTARTEATDGVAKLVALAGQERVMLGTHAPFLIPESAIIRVEEAMLAGLGEAAVKALLGGNAARVMPA